MRGLIEEFAPVLGEVAWHSLTRDPRIAAVSDQHFVAISELLDRHGEPGSPEPTHVLEVASYAHLTGHTLAERRGARVTLFDISARALALGRQMAGGAPENDNPRLVMGDFHDLPFEDESFDLVFISSAIHHTLRWSVLVAELQRVLNAGGLLLIENEPCQRACCTYSFRTNREDQLTPFERKLESLGVIRTFAEPYLGSRPETLFGMTENQQIPLAELLEQLDGPTEILEATFSPELCMGWLESQWVELRELGARELASIISGDLRAARRQALAACDPQQAGLGFTLPEVAEIDRLAVEVAQMICSLSPPQDPEQAHRRGLSEIFGAAVRIAARKRGVRTHPSSSGLKGSYPRFDGVLHTLGGNLGRMLRPGSSKLPDIQVASAEELATVFPAEHWSRVESDGLAAMHLHAQPGILRIPAGAADRILILRLHCNPPVDEAAIVSLERRGEELFVHHCWLPEGFLCAIQLVNSGAAGDTLAVHCRAERNGALVPLDSGLTIAAAALFEEVAPPSVTREIQSYEERVAAEEHNYGERELPGLPEIYAHWAHKFLLPKITDAGFKDMHDVFVQAVVEVSKSRPGPIRVASLGSGEAGFESVVAERLLETGIREVRIDCYELVDSLVERARQSARERGLENHLNPIRADVNRDELQGEYDVVFANQSLHHFTELESIFTGIKARLPDWGLFVVNDMIGRNGHQRWPEAYSLVCNLWKLLPERLKYNHQLARLEPVYENWDCSTDGFEGVRCQDILPLLVKEFEFEHFLGFANLIDVFIDRNFGPNFNTDDPLDRAFIDFVGYLDERLIADGVLTPTHLLGWLRPGPQTKPGRFYPRAPEECIRVPVSNADVEGEDGSRDRLRAVRSDTVLAARTIALATTTPAFPVDRADTFDEYERHLTEVTANHRLRREYEESLIDGSCFTVAGFCYPCGRPVDFEVDLQHCFEVDGKQVPNWRERLICPHCGLNNRMRAAVHLAESILDVGREDRIYLTEATTPLYTWFEREYADVVGSEHLGPETPRGTETRDGLRNEDLTRLTFAEATFDLVVCFDVLEHVPDYRQALRECHRVLRPGGKMLLTVPFRRDSRQNVVRARLLESGEIEHLLPPQYHGDPLDSDGCLAFYEFGWELLDELREIGFARVSGLLYWSLELGYLGVEQIAFAAFKDGPEPPRRARPEESP